MDQKVLKALAVMFGIASLVIALFIDDYSRNTPADLVRMGVSAVVMAILSLTCAILSLTVKQDNEKEIDK